MFLHNNQTNANVHHSDKVELIRFNKRFAVALLLYVKMY